MNPVLENIKTRRSIRAFTDQKVEKELLEELIDAARYAPSGLNRQTWKFTVVQNPQMLEKLAKVIRETLNRGEDYCFYHANVMIIVSNDRDNFLGAPDSACALENIFLAAHSLGLGSVWINQLNDVYDVPEVRAVLDELNMPKNHAVYGMAAIGYPDEAGRPANKKTDVVEWVL